MIDWVDRAVTLANELAARGHLPDPHWREAFATVPRHVFVPRYLRRDETVVDGTHPADREEWLAEVYSDTTLVTQTAPVPGTDLRWPTSSATMPSLMARMLHLLDVADRDRVLEIGTGTGYNAALLCQRLSDDRITTVDIHPALVEAAGAALLNAGHEPHLEVRDGAEGVPGRAPFDRIIATCAVPAIPPAWVTQLNRGGVIVADVRGELCSNLVVLRKIDETAAEGRFLDVAGHFMWLRAFPDNPLRDGGRLNATISRDDAVELVTALDPADLGHPDLRFLIQHFNPAVQRIWPTSRAGTELMVLHADDGSWAEVDTTRHGHTYHVTQGGPHPLWSGVEDTAHLWSRLGRPSRGRFGLTANTDGHHRLWLDSPDGPDNWPIGSRKS